ncbi:MAG: hypothetical protein AAFU55_09985, partial [Pseudomonadota bacterium]
ANAAQIEAVAWDGDPLSLYRATADGEFGQMAAALSRVEDWLTAGVASDAPVIPAIAPRSTLRLPSNSLDTLYTPRNARLRGVKGISRESSSGSANLTFGKPVDAAQTPNLRGDFVR